MIKVYIFNESNNISRVYDFKKFFQCVDSEISLTRVLVLDLSPLIAVNDGDDDDDDDASVAAAADRRQQEARSRAAEAATRAGGVEGSRRGAGGSDAQEAARFRQRAHRTDGPDQQSETKVSFSRRLLPFIITCIVCSYLCPSRRTRDSSTL